MFKSTVFILNPLFLLISWCVFFYSQKGLLVWVILSLLSILLTAIFTSGYSFWKHKLQWSNFLLIYLAQLGFLLMLKNNLARYLSAIVICFLWAFTWWMLKKYFKNYLAPNQLGYMSFKKYWYILNLWFLLSSVYSLTIFLNLDFYYVAILVVLAIMSMTRDLMASKSWHWTFWLLIAIFFAQAFMLVYFLPVSFYVSSTIVTLWFYYFVTLALDDKKKAKWPIFIILLVTTFLLVSSLYIIL